MIMKTNEITLKIPAPIAARPGLTLHERVALAFVHEHPRCRNITLARHLGISVRGAEAMLRRLRQLGHIRSAGRGRARRMEVSFPAEPTKKCGVQQETESHTKCKVEQPIIALVQHEPSTSDFAELHLSLYETCLEHGDFESACHHLDLIRERLERDAEFPAEQKTNLLAALAHMENRCFCFRVGREMAEGLPASEQRALALEFCRASPGQLASFRQQMESGELPGEAVKVIGLRSE